MYLTLTNKTTEATIIASEQDGKWADVLEPDKPYAFNRPGTSVAVIGDKPDVIDAIVAGITVVGEFLRALIEKLTGSRSETGAPAPDQLFITIHNRGHNGVRVLLGDGVNDHTVWPGGIYDATSTGYMELRELGLVQPASPDPAQQPGQAA